MSLTKSVHQAATMSPVETEPGTDATRTRAVQPSGTEAESLRSAEARTAGINSTENRPAADDDKVCWIEMKRYPYQADHQVELLHLQAEADALLIRLQASSQRKSSEKAEK
ncbi:MAG: hypothetical protein AAFY72_03290 [Cyanobacteria bacterium J06649_4]